VTAARKEAKKAGHALSATLEMDFGWPAANEGTARTPEIMTTEIIKTAVTLIEIEMQSNFALERLWSGGVTLTLQPGR